MGTTVPTKPFASLLLLLAAAIVGCQPSQETMTRQLSARMTMIDFSGLAPAKPIAGLEVSAAVPRSWELLPVQKGTMFSHRQWRTPGHTVSVGVVHVRLPLPMSAQTLVWLAKAKYDPVTDKPGGKSADQKPADHGDAAAADAKSKVPGGKGRLLGEWTDAVGREWVEAENDRFHVRGYAVTCGFDAWLVYTGYKRKGMPDPVDLTLAARSMESVVPDPLAPKGNDESRSNDKSMTKAQ